MLHDAAGALRSHTVKGPAYSGMIGQRETSYLLGHVTGQTLCLYIKTLSAFHFQFCPLLKQYVLNYTVH